MKISIIIPAHNEEKRIGNTLNEYVAFFNKLKKQKILDTSQKSSDFSPVSSSLQQKYEKLEDFEILVVINNTQDSTEEIVKNYSKKYKEIRYLIFKEGGKGFAIIEGFKDALKRNNDLIGFVDADMATPPEAFYKLIERINSYDGTIASRSLKESKVEMSFKRKITHKGFNLVVRSILFLPYGDTQCGAKIFTKKAIASIINELGITQWGFDVDLLYKLNKKGFKIKEIPTIWKDRSGSKLNLKSVPLRMFASVIRLRILNSPFKRFMKIYDKMPEWLKFHHNIY